MNTHLCFLVGSSIVPYCDDCSLSLLYLSIFITHVPHIHNCTSSLSANPLTYTCHFPSMSQRESFFIFILFPQNYKITEPTTRPHHHLIVYPIPKLPTANPLTSLLSQLLCPDISYHNCITTTDVSEHNVTRDLYTTTADSDFCPKWKKWQSC